MMGTMTHSEWSSWLFLLVDWLSWLTMTSHPWRSETLSKYTLPLSFSILNVHINLHAYQTRVIAKGRAMLIKGNFFSYSLRVLLGSLFRAGLASMLIMIHLSIANIVCVDGWDGIKKSPNICDICHLIDIPLFLSEISSFLTLGVTTLAHWTTHGILLQISSALVSLSIDFYQKKGCKNEWGGWTKKETKHITFH